MVIGALAMTTCVGLPPAPPVRDDTSTATTESSILGTSMGTAADPLGTTTTSTTGADTTATTSVGVVSTSDGSTSASTGTGDTDVPPVELERCNDEDFSIPDDDPLGVLSSLEILEEGTIVDLRVAVLVTHVWVGDLTFQLSHDATDLVVLDRPGNDMCSGNDVDVVLRDDAVETIDAACQNDGEGVPALAGDLLPESSLAPTFVGLPMAGTWGLRVSDGNMQDTGVLTRWCLQITYR